MVAGCSLPKPNFDIKGYADNFWKKGTGIVGYGKNRIIRKETSLLLTSNAPAIYGFGGLDVFGDGQTDNVLDNLCPIIRTSECHYHKLGKYPEIMDNIKSQYRAGNPIIFIAHSAGCGEAVNVASILEQTNVPVGIIFLDAAYLKDSNLFPPGIKEIEGSDKIPGNVYRIENYISKGPYKGRELRDGDFKNNNTAGTKYRDFRLDASHGGMTKKFTNEYIKSLGRILGEYGIRYGY